MREELGGPALVPPVAQVIATQAVLNVVYGRRWRMVPDEMRAYLRGEYGEPPRERTVELEHHAGEPTEPVDQQPVPDQAFLLPGDNLHAVAPLATMEYLERRTAAAESAGCTAHLRRRRKASPICRIDGMISDRRASANSWPSSSLPP